MAHNLTESDAHTANVSVPDDGDARNAASVETPFQSLANRTHRANLRLNAKDAFAEFTLSGTGLAASALVTVTEAVDPSSGYSVGSNLITFPGIGYYLLTLMAAMTTTDTADPVLVALSVHLNGVLQQNFNARRFSATAGDNVYLAGSRIIQVTNAGHTLSVSILAGLTGNHAVTDGKLGLHRLTYT